MPRVVRHIYDERPHAKVWDSYLYLESETAALNILTRCYERGGEVNAERLAYQNTPPFIYHLKQAREYYRAARQAHLIVRPLLLYYGMMGLTKAYVLTLNPHYPDHTRLLRHGMSTRKRKKQHYRFRDDEVKIQKEGLLPHVLTLLGLRNGLEEKYLIRECLGQLPQLYSSFQQVTQRTFLHPVYIPHFLDDTFVYVEESLLDEFHLSAEGFVHMLNRHHLPSSKGRFLLKEERTNGRYFTVHWKHPDVTHVSKSGKGFENSMFLADASGQFFIRLTTDRRLHLPEFIFHLLLLFHLGMLARYETAHWGEIVLTFSSEERFLIHELLQLTERQFPNLLLNEIMDETFVYTHP